MSLESGIEGTLQILGESVAGERDQRCLLEQGVGAEGPRHLVAVHPRQADITEHDLG